LITYLLGVALLVAVPLVFFAFLVFFTFLVAPVFWLVLVPELVAGACWANANGIMAAVNPSASNVFFMFPYLPVNGLFVRSHFHDAAQSAEIR
jgi:hypothetical protein